MDQIKENEISIYNFPEEEGNPNPFIKSKLPVGVVGSNIVVTNGARQEVSC
jgi:hypothetical protein